MSTTTIRLGGVPEHFNLPIHLAIERGDFVQKGIDLQWIDCPGGTGQMTKALREGETDVCIALTEGMIADIIRGNPSKLVSTYVTSPLIWGIHTGANNELKEGDDFFDRQHAISRFGSGSHLMAIVNANSHSLAIKKEQFTVIDNLSNALESLEQLETDVFYWEKFTTKPYVDSGQLRKIGAYPTPWPCFVIAASDKIMREQPQAINSMLDVIHKSCGKFMNNPAMIPLVSQGYKQREEDIQEWYQMTQWAVNSSIDQSMIDEVVTSLKAAGIISESQLVPELIAAH